MPSLSKTSKSKSKLRVQKLKKSAKALKNGKNGKNGHKNGLKTAFAALAVKVKTSVKAKSPGKRVYFFGGGKSEGSKEMKNLLGGKGANLAEMANIGLPVP